MTRLRILAALLVAVFTMGPASAQEFSWKFQSSSQAGEIAFAIMRDFAESIVPLTNGRLSVELLPVGAVVQYNETLDAVSAGLLDGHMTGTVYFSGKNPAFAMLGDLIAAYDHPDQMFLFLRRGGGDELIRELYAGYGLHYIGGATTGKEALVSTIALRGIEDFDGIKIRAPEGMAQDIFERIGAAPVNLPSAEVFTAVERGVVDAADWAPFSMNHQIGFHKIARFPIYPGIHSLPVIDVSVNRDRWEELPDDIQAILEAAVWNFSRDITHRLELQDITDVAEAQADGIEVIDWPLEERAALRKIATGIWDDWADRSPLARRAYEAQISFLRAVGLLAD